MDYSDWFEARAEARGEAMKEYAEESDEYFTIEEIEEKILNGDFDYKIKERIKTATKDDPNLKSMVWVTIFKPDKMPNAEAITKALEKLDRDYWWIYGEYWKKR